MTRNFVITVFFILSQGCASQSIRQANTDTLEGCENTEYGSGYSSYLPINKSPELIMGAEPLTSSGKIICKIGPNYEAPSSNELLRVEEGSISEVRYRIYLSDGSGSIQGTATSFLDVVKDHVGTNWATRCEVDEFDDRHWCALDRGHLRIGIWKDGSHFVVVGNNRYPNSTVAIRIDKNKPIVASEQAGFTQEQVAMIFAQMESGKRILTRYQEWPYQINKDESSELYKFTRAWELLERIYARVRAKRPQ